MKNGSSKQTKNKTKRMQAMTDEMRSRVSTIGIDLGDRWSSWCGVDERGQVVVESRLRTSKLGFGKEFDRFSRPTRMVIEEGSHAHWVASKLQEMGFEVVIADPRKVRLIYENRKKTDRVDAKYLAQLGQANTELLHPIQHRSEEIQRDLGTLKAREAIVGTRTKLINHVRGQVKTTGERIPKCGAEAFHRVANETLPDELRTTLEPILALIGRITEQIRSFDREIATLCKEKYPQSLALMAIRGVGPLTALATVLVLADPGRFRKSRDVGAYLGLVPARDDSGEHSPQLRITKTGDAFLRRLLIQAAHYILGRFGEDCDLQQFGLRIAGRGGKIAKKKAVVAVARKLAVVMHRLLLTGDAYDPFYNASSSEAAA